MPTIDQAIDIDRALDAALADAGEAVELRRRALSDAGLRRGLRGVESLHTGSAVELDESAAARRATAHFILTEDSRVGPFAERAGTHRALYLWGLSELFRNRPTVAARALARCIEVEPRDEQARLRLAPLQALLGDSETARATLGELAGQTERPQVLFALGAIAEVEGDYARAREHYESALAQDPQHLDSLFRLAYQHDLSGDDDAAIALYERARRIRPTRVNVLVNLGVLYEDRGEYAKASEAYREILVQYPNHPRARSFLRDAQASQSMVVDEDMERTEDRRNQILRIPITDFELSVRSRNCLAKMNISKLGDLIQRTEAELLAYKNFGETSLQEIKDILVAKGLRLGMRREEILAQEEAGEPGTTLPDIPFDTAERAAAVATPISDMDFSVRSSKCMALMNIETVGDLIQHTEADLLRIKNFGVTSLHEVKTKLAKLGLSLK